MNSLYLTLVLIPLRVDFHCRVIFTCVYKHANFNLVNKIEARYKLLSFFFSKLSEVQILRLRATFQTLPLFYLRT